MHSYNHKSCRQTVDDKALCPLLDKQNKTEGYKNDNENRNCLYRQTEGPGASLIS